MQTLEEWQAEDDARRPVRRGDGASRWWKLAAVFYGISAVGWLVALLALLYGLVFG